MQLTSFLVFWLNRICNTSCLHHLAFFIPVYNPSGAIDVTENLALRQKEYEKLTSRGPTVGRSSNLLTVTKM